MQLQSKTITVLEKPEGYEDDLSDYQVIYEENDIPFAWGFEIKHHLGDDRFSALNQYGKIVHLGDYFSGRWALIAKELTHDECIDAAIKKYGAISKLVTGPRGGFRSVTYGTKKSKYGDKGERFWSRDFDPTYRDSKHFIDYKTDPRAELE